MFAPIGDDSPGQFRTNAGNDGKLLRLGAVYWDWLKDKVGVLLAHQHQLGIVIKGGWGRPLFR